MIQSILIAYFAFQLKKIVKARKESEILRFSNDQKELIQDDERQKCLEQQMNHMSVFYIIFSIIDILLLVVGDIVNSSKPIFACSQSIYMLPRNDGGAIYLFVDGLIFFLFSLNISHIFYKIPDKYGLVLKKSQGSIDNLSLDKLTFVKS